VKNQRTLMPSTAEHISGLLWRGVGGGGDLESSGGGNSGRNPIITNKALGYYMVSLRGRGGQQTLEKEDEKPHHSTEKKEKQKNRKGRKTRVNNLPD